jgi:hypothetical protein
MRKIRKIDHAETGQNIKHMEVLYISREEGILLVKR